MTPADPLDSASSRRPVGNASSPNCRNRANSCGLSGIIYTACRRHSPLLLGTPNRFSAITQLLWVVWPFLDNAMHCASRPIRVSVLCLLTTSLAVATLFQPAPMRRFARANCIETQPARRCCCGCQDCHCGVCCCNESAPQEVPATPPVRSSGSDEFKPLVLFHWLTTPAESAAGAILADHRRTDGHHAPCAPSLQASHVRIQT